MSAIKDGYKETHVHELVETKARVHSSSVLFACGDASEVRGLTSLYSKFEQLLLACSEGCGRRDNRFKILSATSICACAH